MSDQTRVADSAGSAPAIRSGERADTGRTQTWMAAGGILAALAASACCVLPFVLFSLGVGGAWMSNLTALAPYQPYFIAAAGVFLGFGYWLVYRDRRTSCAQDEACARPLPNRLVLSGLIAATALVIAAVGFNLVAPILLN
jgi:mercuric ion transport protein